tara:strand:+ start:368 stop:583 length:216 start_codon:yes stop_codon:yes gene_type:complete
MVLENERNMRMLRKKNSGQIADNRKQWKRGWPYKGDVDDPRYMIDRKEVFKESGNGWWWYQGVYSRDKSNA